MRELYAIDGRLGVRYGVVAHTETIVNSRRLMGMRRNLVVITPNLL
jgi:hypothetical protein